MRTHGVKGAKEVVRLKAEAKQRQCDALRRFRENSAATCAAKGLQRDIANQKIESFNLTAPPFAHKFRMPYDPTNFSCANCQATAKNVTKFAASPCTSAVAVGALQELRVPLRFDRASASRTYNRVTSS